jgi:hypothetical protein
MELYVETDDRSDACGDACINRMLYVECSPRDCPVGDACLNRRYFTIVACGGSSYSEFVDCKRRSMHRLKSFRPSQKVLG